jgi:hypothetical protein
MMNLLLSQEQKDNEFLVLEHQYRIKHPKHHHGVTEFERPHIR